MNSIDPNEPLGGTLLLGVVGGLLEVILRLLGVSHGFLSFLATGLLCAAVVCLLLSGALHAYRLIRWFARPIYTRLS